MYDMKDPEEKNGAQGGIQVIARAASILRTLEHHPGGLSLGQIAKSVGLARSTVQRIVAALAAEDFVIAAGPGDVRIGPGLVRIAQRLDDEPRFQLIAVSCGSGGDDADLARETTSFLAARQLPIAAWGFSEAVVATHFSLAYGLEAFPTTYLIGPDARVRRVWTGYRSSDEADIAAAILVLLKEQGP